MFYVARILDDKNKVASRAYVEVYSSSHTIKTQKKFGLRSDLDYKFYIYDDTDSSLELVNINTIIKCFFLNITIEGITSGYINSTDLIALHICVAGIPTYNFYNVFQLSNVVLLDRTKFRFNPNLFNKSIDPRAVEYIEVKDADKLYFVDSNGSLQSTYSILQYSKSILDNKHKIYSINSTILVYKIENNFKVLTVWDSVDFSQYVYSLIDLYVLATLYPESNIFSHIIDDTTFIVDAIFNRYIFKTSPKLKTSILRNKLSGKFYW